MRPACRTDGVSLIRRWGSVRSLRSSFRIFSAGKFTAFRAKQFGDEAKELVYDDRYPQSREVHFAKAEKLERYLVLKSLVEGYKP